MPGACSSASPGAPGGSTSSGGPGVHRLSGGRPGPRHGGGHGGASHQPEGRRRRQPGRLPDAVPGGRAGPAGAAPRHPGDHRPGGRPIWPAWPPGCGPTRRSSPACGGATPPFPPSWRRKGAAACWSCGTGPWTAAGGGQIRPMALRCEIPQNFSRFEEIWTTTGSPLSQLRHPRVPFSGRSWGKNEQPPDCVDSQKLLVGKIKF